MINVDYSIGLDPRQDIGKRIVLECAFIFNKLLTAAVPVIVSRTRSAINRLLRHSDIYKNLVSGELKGVFGFVSSTLVDRIIEAVATNIDVKTSGPTIKGDVFEFELEISILDYQNLLSMADSVYKTGNVKKGTQYDIQWLKWLITGHDDVEPGWSLHTDLTSEQYKRSRSKLSIMLEDKKDFNISVYEGIGTGYSDNWLHNILSSAEFGDILEKIFQEEIIRRLK